MNVILLQFIMHFRGDYPVALRERKASNTKRLLWVYARGGGVTGQLKLPVHIGNELPCVVKKILLRMF
jgi:hypothetical protein